MLEQNAKKSVQEVVRDTFTPSRVGLLSWAFAAVCMGTVGLASYQFGSSTKFNDTLNGTPRVVAGLPLPPAGQVETTASIGGGRPVVEIMTLSGNQAPPQSIGQTQSQIEVMQKELVGLRRRLMDLSEQNRIYSKRIATLEKEVAVSKLAGLNDTGSGKTSGSHRNAEPVPGVVKTNGPQAANPEAVALTDAQSGSDYPPIVVSDAPELKREDGIRTPPRISNPPRLISIYRDNRTKTPDLESTSEPSDPVRIVALPQTEIVTLPQPPADEAPIVTGSVPSSATDTLPEEFDQTPTRTTLEPTIVTPSDAVGRLRGGSESQIKRSDFGAVIGHYKTTASAAKAWADFKEQNEERMKDLRPLLLERQVAEGGVSLLVGPFGNAADAAVACLHLLDVTELCHPALFAGTPLITAAEFRDSAFD